MHRRAGVERQRHRTVGLPLIVEHIHAHFTRFAGVIDHPGEAGAKGVGRRREERDGMDSFGLLGRRRDDVEPEDHCRERARRSALGTLVMRRYKADSVPQPHKRRAHDRTAPESRPVAPAAAMATPPVHDNTCWTTSKCL